MTDPHSSLRPCWLLTVPSMRNTPSFFLKQLSAPAIPEAPHPLGAYVPPASSQPSTPWSVAQASASNAFISPHCGFFWWDCVSALFNAYDQKRFLGGKGCRPKPPMAFLTENYQTETRRDGTPLPPQTPSSSAGSKDQFGGRSPPPRTLFSSRCRLGGGLPTGIVFEGCEVPQCPPRAQIGSPGSFGWIFTEPLPWLPTKN